MSTEQQPQLDSVVTAVINSFKQRAEFGQKKYGTNLDRTDLNVLDWIQHAQEEHMDAILYLEKLKQCFQNQDQSKTNQVQQESQKAVVAPPPDAKEKEEDKHLTHWGC